jgi:hypothetical protein
LNLGGPSSLPSLVLATLQPAKHSLCVSLLYPQNPPLPERAKKGEGFHFRWGFGDYCLVGVAMGVLFAATSEGGGVGGYEECKQFKWTALFLYCEKTLGDLSFWWIMACLEL